MLVEEVWEMSVPCRKVTASPCRHFEGAHCDERCDWLEMPKWETASLCRFLDWVQNDRRCDWLGWPRWEAVCLCRYSDHDHGGTEGCALSGMSRRGDVEEVSHHPHFDCGHIEGSAWSGTSQQVLVGVVVETAERCCRGCRRWT